MTSGPTFTFRPRGELSWPAAVGFLATNPAVDVQVDGDVVTWPFLSDEGEAVVVRVRRTPSRVLADVLAGDGDLDRLRRQVARLFSLDVDPAPYEAITDPVVAHLRSEHPGLRPVHLATPYDAAVWAVLVHRTQKAQAARLRQWLAEHHGTAVEVDGVVHHTAARPEALVDLRSLPGLPGPKLPWLRDVARAALEGDLDPEHLLGQEPEEALRGLRRIEGIGPFSAEVILVRGAGHPDVHARSEPLLRRLLEQHYGSADTEVVQTWRPRRSWAAFLLRTAAQSTSTTTLPRT